MKPKRFFVDGSLDDPIPEDIYPVINTELGWDNIENDLPDSDLQDLYPRYLGGA